MRRSRACARGEALRPGVPGRRLAPRSSTGTRGRLARLAPARRPVGWLVVAYLGSLVVLFVAALWRLDPFTAEIVHDYSLDNFRLLWESDVYRGSRSGRSGSPPR